MPNIGHMEFGQKPLCSQNSTSFDQSLKAVEFVTIEHGKDL